MDAFADRQQLAQLPRSELETRQLEKLNRLLARILPQNTFYAEKLAGVTLPLRALEDLAELPTTTKAELQAAGSVTANCTYPLDAYVRFHRTSGTHGQPLVVPDTAEDWDWWVRTWQFVLDAAHLKAHDRVLMAFSFGPFIGFWSAHDAVTQRGAMAIPAGGLSSAARLELLASSEATVMCCTPTYALRLAEVAGELGKAIADLPLSRIIVAGEPGGSLPAVRQRIEAAWGAQVIDHTGATEVGPWGFGDARGQGIHIIETEFLAEFWSVETGAPAAEGELAELLLTTLGRAGAPVLRYRTGDLVRPVWPQEGPTRFVHLEGGVLGRADDMLVIRGVNIFPSSLEQILREFDDVSEYRITARRDGEMDSLHVEIEDALGAPQRIAEALQVRLGLHVDVVCAEAGSLPRFEAKAKRFIDLR